jgi:hypothetical protein
MSKTIEIDDIEPAPWGRLDWTGKLVAVDDAPAHDFAREDVERVIAFGTTGDEWDGETAAIVLLKDGRYAAWEASWGPTGNGFVCDAYGGDSDILFAATEDAAREALTDRGRELLTC